LTTGRGINLKTLKWRAVAVCLLFTMSLLITACGDDRAGEPSPKEEVTDIVQQDKPAEAESNEDQPTQSAKVQEDVKDALIYSNFEDGTRQSWKGRGGSERLTAATEAAHLGQSGLHVANRSKNWHGPILDVTEQMEQGQTYTFTAWVKLPEGASEDEIDMTMQRNDGNANYERIVSTRANAQEWTKIEGNYAFKEPGVKMQVYLESPNETLEFYLDDFYMVKVASTGSKVVQEEIPSLHEVFKDKFIVGSAFLNHEMYGEDGKLLLKHFASLTPGNVMKMDATHPAEGKFTFDQADAAVNFAAENGKKVRGHTLVWHNQTPDWIFHDNEGKLVSKEVLFDRMKAHIQTMVNRYKDRVDTWDVVNEVIDPDQPDGMRRSLWYEIAGEEYIEKAFIYAHEADPNAKLFINDYNTEEPKKREYLYKLVKSLLDKDIPVTGVGHQLHLQIEYPNAAWIDESLTKFAELGIDQQVTELDISSYNDSVTKYDALTDEVNGQQAERYKSVFEVLLKHADDISSVTLWGKDDANSWLRSFPISRNNWPLLFDDNLQAKPAYWSVVGVMGVNE
jgi:endo-1,4-beta-xylanase